MTTKTVDLGDFAWVRLGTVRDVRTRTKRPADGWFLASEGGPWVWEKRVERGKPRLASVRVAQYRAGHVPDAPDWGYSVTLDIYQEGLKGMEPGLPFQVRLQASSLQDAAWLLLARKKLHTHHSARYPGPWYEASKRTVRRRVIVSYWPRHVPVAYVEIMNNDELADALDSLARVL